MEFFECALGRRSCRRFKQDPISRTNLDRMIDAGRYAPTGYNKQAIRPYILISLGRPDETFVVDDPSDEWQVRKDSEGVVHLGKRGRKDVTVAVL